MSKKWQMLSAGTALLMGWQGAALAVANLNIRVVDDGKPIPGVSIKILDVNGNVAVAANDDNNDGIVLLPVTEAGSYVIVTTAPNGKEQRTRVAVPSTGSHALRVNLPDGRGPAPRSRSMAADSGGKMMGGEKPADGVNYDYLQVSWIIESEVEDLGGNDFDGEGVGFDASRGLGNSYYFRASSWAPVYNDDFGATSDTEFALTDWQSVAFGYHQNVVDRGDTYLDAFLQAGYDRLQVGGPLLPEPATGLGLSGGLRLQVNSFEMDVYARYADASAGDVDVEPLLYGVDLRYRVTPNLAVSVGYADGEVEISQGGAAGFDEEPDLSMFTAGLRYYYGQPWTDGGSRPDDPPTSYNYLQFDYLVDGEFNVEGVPGNDSVDADRGIGIDASYLLADNFFLRATNWTVDYDVPGSTSDIVLTDMLSAGPGARYGMPVGKSYVDGYLQVTYDRINTVGLTAEGYGGEAGIRYLIVPGLELNAWYREASTEGRLLAQDVEIDSELWGLRLIMGPENAEKWSDIDFVISWTDGEAEVDDGTGSQDLEFDSLTFGVRYTY